MTERITKENLALALQKEASMSENESLEFVQAFFGLIGKTLEEERYVKIKGLGTFKLISVDSRRSVDVNTGKNIEIPSHHKVSFTPETPLRELINKPFSHFEAVELKEEVSLEVLSCRPQEEVVKGVETVSGQFSGKVEKECPENVVSVEEPCGVKEQADEDKRKSHLAFGIIVSLVLFTILVGMLFLFVPEFLEKLIYE